MLALGIREDEPHTGRVKLVLTGDRPFAKGGIHSRINRHKRFQGRK